MVHLGWTHELNALGYSISANTTALLMRKQWIKAKRKLGDINLLKPLLLTHRIVLMKKFIKGNFPTAFGQQLIADITYIPTKEGLALSKEGWLYLSVCIDLYTRLV